MLAIKFRRIGRKHQPSFRIVVAEKRSKATGKFVEDLGWRDPKSKDFKLKEDRVRYWLKTGAQPTDSVHNLFVKTGIIKGKKRPVHKIKKNKKDEIPVEKVENKEVEKSEEVEKTIEEEKKEKDPAVTKDPETQLVEAETESFEEKKEKGKEPETQNK